MANRNYILSKEEAIHKLKRLALELAEELSGDDAPVVIIGIRNSGTVIAEKVGKFLQEHIPNRIDVISAALDKTHPVNVELSSAMNFDGLHVVVADDVSNSGKTLLYALKPLLQYHPRTIRTLVLVERMHKLFPVKPDHVGLSMATTLQDHIQVEVDNGEVTGAYIA
ncbi:phosphoribosyltransferase family protein [Sediminibacterium soli]|uniref:phosphoribosyltransferase family protein n=1 Tax=Sediminibacterium soli TaxID=2698829 RepID=UPI00137A640B|nr:phosphoribosyltransferase family protein [Sediminibacterium soli]NCI46946.1 phosphoribosyltransferase [Sediminibacterium soli]